MQGDDAFQVVVVISPATKKCQFFRVTGRCSARLRDVQVQRYNPGSREETMQPCLRPSEEDRLPFCEGGRGMLINSS
jgi:hypothetical protein